MERGRYNGNSRMSKDCITYGTTSARNDPRSTAREQVSLVVGGGGGVLAPLSFVKGNTIISSSLFAILKYVRRWSDCFYLPDLEPA